MYSLLRANFGHFHITSVCVSGLLGYLHFLLSLCDSYSLCCRFLHSVLQARPYKHGKGIMTSSLKNSLQLALMLAETIERIALFWNMKTLPVPDKQLHTNTA